jgi:aspartate aminotransferase
MAISNKVRQHMQEGGWIRRMFEEGLALKAKYGERNVFDLSLGNPVMEPPPEFHRALERCVSQPAAGMHRYMPNAGYPETRTAVANHLAEVTGLPFTQSEILMSSGCAGAINAVLKTICEEGDEVIIFAPYFAEYIYYIDNHGAVPCIVPSDSHFQPDLDRLSAAIGPRTRAVLVNSPNNPTGMVYPEALFQQMGRIIQAGEKRHNREIFFISDDVYRRLTFDGLKSPYIFPYHVRSILATSHSKDLALPGERIGYIAVNPGYEGREELVSGLIFSSRVLGFVNAPALMQHVVRGLQSVSVDVNEYARKRDYLYENLTVMGYDIIKPSGAFYVFPRCPIPDDVAFIRELQQHRVMTVPGSGFGAPGYFRISYCTEDWVIEGSLAGFRAVARHHGLS